MKVLNTTQHNTTQHNTTQHNTTQHNTTQHEGLLLGGLFVLKGLLCLLALLAAAAAACAASACEVRSAHCPSVFTAPLPRSGGCGDVTRAVLRGRSPLSLDSRSGLFRAGALLPLRRLFKNSEAFLLRPRPANSFDIFELCGFSFSGSCDYCGSRVSYFSVDFVLVASETRFIVALRYLKNPEACSLCNVVPAYMVSGFYIGISVAPPVLFGQLGCFVVAIATFKNSEAPLFGSGLTHHFFDSSFSLGSLNLAYHIVPRFPVGICGGYVVSTLQIVLVCSGILCLVVAFATFKNLETPPSRSSSFSIDYISDHLSGDVASRTVSLLATPLSLSPFLFAW